MADKKSFKEICKENKDKIIGAAVIAGTGVTCYLIGKRVSVKQICGGLKYKTCVSSDSQEYIDGLREVFNWNGGKRSIGAYMGWGCNREELLEKVTTIMQEHPENYEYGLVLEYFEK